MDRVPVQSSNLASVGYDPTNSTLEVEFRHGGIFQYFGVPQYVYDGLLSASSKGTYFDQHVKKAGYSYTRVG
ncbi:MAG: KTSC domain-containing protein [Elusimicrobia bacterium]|nr:KTSC domain-containing protein [Elusimicrobiota bacterium]